MSVCFEHTLTFDHFLQMEALEASCYSADYIAPAAEAFAWYQAHPHSVLVACEGDRVAGFVNLLPVSVELFERILAGSFNDAALTADDILSLEACSNGPFELFLSCIVVGEEWRGSGLARDLLARALGPYASEGLPCRFVVTDNVTREGERFSERWGFRFAGESDHGTKVYRHELADLAKSLGI